MFDGLKQGRKEIFTAEDVKRQVAIVVVVPLEEP